MENFNPAAAVSTDQTCASCLSAVNADAVSCVNCGYPLKGTPEEQNAFELRRSNNQIDLQEYTKVLNSAGNYLYYLAAIFIISGIVKFFIKQEDPQVIYFTTTYVVLGVIFLALGGFSRKKPLACLVAGLVLYIAVQGIGAIYDPINLFKSFIFQVLIIGYLLKGIRSAMDIEKIKKENGIV